MPLGNPFPGPNLAGEYLIPGLPYVTSSVLSTARTAYNFPFIAKNFTIKNVSGSANIKVAFCENGLTSTNYFELSPSEGFSGEIRCASLYVSGAVGTKVSLVAGLTGVPTRYMLPMTASNYYEGVG